VALEVLRPINVKTIPEKPKRDTTMEIIRHSRHNGNISKAERVASVVGGGVLTWYGLRRKSPAGYALAAIGGDLMRRGATGHSFFYEAIGVRTRQDGQGANVSVPYELGVRVDRIVTVNKAREEIYRFWRQLENLPRFMRHLQSVKDLGFGRSHWVATGPAGRTVEWDAEILTEKEHELISWRSLAGSGVQNAGSVHFRDARGGRGTEVSVELQYNPPGGLVGATVAKLFGEEPTRQIAEDLSRFKALMEAGEVPTTRGQSQVVKNSDLRAERKQSDDQVRRESEHSFPASDAPSSNR
jgi:uncharacterized membrane protein